MKRWSIALALVLATPIPVRAHDGPPYPILVDHPIAGCELSIWADPDVGVGTFYFYVNEPGSERPTERGLDVRVQPVDGRLPEAVQSSETADEDEPYQRIAEIPFDARGFWDVAFDVHGPDGVESVALEVEVTPPGLGEIDILWFLSPFLVVAFFWVKIVLKRREYERASPCTSTPSS